MGRPVMMAASNNISQVVDMEAVRAALLSCQRFTASYLCSLKLSVCLGFRWVCAAQDFCCIKTIFSSGRK